MRAKKFFTQRILSVKKEKKKLSAARLTTQTLQFLACRYIGKGKNHLLLIFFINKISQA